MPSRIEDYAIIGDCLSSALVSRAGSIDWLCWPRFDSDACFAALLGDEKNGRWLIAPNSPIESISRRYLPSTLILETTIKTESGVVMLIDYMPIGQTTSHVIRRVAGVSGTVSMRMELIVRFDYGSSIPWLTRLGDDDVIQAIVGPHMTVLRSSIRVDIDNYDNMVCEFSIGEGKSETFSLSYQLSHLQPPAALDCEEVMLRTRNYWQQWCAALPRDMQWRDAIERSLITLKALTYAPTGALVAAVTTSLPEHLGGVRNWDYRYCWLRDATLTLMTLMNAGYFDEAEAWRRWLIRAVAGSPKQLQIMYGIAGERRLTEYEATWLNGYENSRPVHIGNFASNQLQLDVFGELMDALYQARKGSLPIDAAAWELQVELLKHLEELWREPDEGIWEVRGGRQHFTYSKIMTWVAFDRGVKSIDQFNLEGPREHWGRIRDEIHREVCLRGYSEKRNCFVQSYEGTSLDASLLQIPLVGFLPADDPRVIGTVAAIEKELMRDGLVVRYRTEEVADGLPAGEGVFLACSFWLVDSYVLQERFDEAEALFSRLLNLCNDVGLLSEEYDPENQRLIGNFPQAFSHTAIINAAINLSSHGKIAEKRKT